jgi:hypothetical protein
MAVRVGRTGAVYFGTNQVAEVNSWQYDEAAEEIVVQAMGDTAKRYESGLTDHSGSFACNYDDSDTTGQESIAIGDTVTVSLRPEDAVGAPEFVGSVKINGISISSSVDGITQRSYTFRGLLTAGAII